MNTQKLQFGPTGFLSSTAISFHESSPSIKMTRYERLLYRNEIRNPVLHQQDCGLVQ